MFLLEKEKKLAINYLRFYVWNPEKEEQLTPDKFYEGNNKER